MKVTCQSCQAKYTIADEKVRGKVAKIRCKKCGTTIIVNGTDASSSGGAVADYTQQGPADEKWSILVADGDQRELTISQVAELYGGGSISLETPAWKDGMPDWLPISQIDALRTVIEHGPQPSMLPDHGHLASLLPDVQAQAAAAAPVMPAAPEPVAPRVPAPAARINAPAARRPRGGSTDLFGAAAHDDVMTSASADPVPHMPAAGNDKPTGARNENSVLFSLAALTGGPSGGGGGGGGLAAKPAPSVDKGPPASSKADLRSLMAGTDNKPAPQKSKLDDIINLSGGGVYSPAMLTAPILAPPPVELPVAGDVVGATAKPKSKLTLLLVGAVVLIGVGAAAFTMNSKAESDKAMAAASASAKAASDALAAALAAAQEAKAAPEPTAAPEAASGAPTALAPGQAAPKPEAAEKKTVAAAAKVVDKGEKPAAPPPGPPGAAALGIPPPAPAPKAPEPAPAGGGGDFDRAAALSALSAAATAAQSCKKSDGPTGSGRIAVTFANNGQATTANVEGPPFSGTPVGGCVAARFRGTHVPPFGGAPVTVHKTFNIN
jgi:predicted Zn finger-like uncharacterized protein